MCDRDQKPQFNSLPLWLLILALSLTFNIQRALAADQERPAASPKLPERIATLDGKTYEKVTLEKVEPDGLLVTFAPVEGGSGTAKLKFRNLPPDLRDRFGYDPARAADYEAARAHGAAIWLAESAAWTEQRRTALAEQATWERQMRAQTDARIAAEAEQAQIEAARNAQEPSYYYPGYYAGWWWPGTFNSVPRHHIPAAHHNQNHMRPAPAVGITPSPISPNIGPMRPGGR